MTSNYTIWSGFEQQLYSDLKEVIKKYGSASYLDLLDITDFGDVLLKRTLKKVIKRGFIKHHSAEDNLFEHYTATTPHSIKQ